MDGANIESNYFRVNLFNGVCIAYIDCNIDISHEMKPKGTVVLIHGFPETSWAFRKVVPPIANAGYRVIAPDYRGAGESSKPSGGFTKAIMAADIIALLDHLDIDERVHVIGHDIGGIIAFVLASRWPERVISACLSECLLPGSNTYTNQLAENPVEYFHFNFHCVDNLPEALIIGREKLYIDYFINRRCYRIGAFPPDVITRYAHALSQPGALRCALDLYRSLDKDAEDTREWVSQHGKCQVPCMVLSGEHSSYGQHAERMALEVVDKPYLTSTIVKGSGHFIPEENSSGFSEKNGSGWSRRR
ncbi:hypothetical protein LTR37_020844 [Vermiconidia calcicola]|uniref:Uncharacterized protein n=1 Tax=Vermiconidia calcicola TaxID=1690605 RepID=A0ACC3MA88_9PEZI|nr:hypothetical protein LTR37_020844 [Vermiconidia calcicola]